MIFWRSIYNKISGIATKFMAFVAALITIWHILITGWRFIKELKEGKEVYDAIVDLGIPIEIVGIVLLVAAIALLSWSIYKKPWQLPEKKY